MFLFPPLVKFISLFQKYLKLFNPLKLVLSMFMAEKAEFAIKRLIICLISSPWQLAKMRKYLVVSANFAIP